jgi:hypothetical protein
MVNAITTTNFISETVLGIRDNLIGSITDPISGTRPSGEKFIMTSYPKRAVHYPLITVKSTNVSFPNRMGFQSTLHYTKLPIEIRVWARNEIEKDRLSQNVINQLRQIEYATSGTVQANLLSFKVNSAINVDEEGEEGIKSKIIAVEYEYILGT